MPPIKSSVRCEKCGVHDSTKNMKKIRQPGPPKYLCVDCYEREHEKRNRGHPTHPPRGLIDIFPM